MIKLIQLSNGSYRVLQQIGHGASSKVYLVTKLLCSNSKIDLHQLPTSTGDIPKSLMEENLSFIKQQNCHELRSFWSVGDIKEAQWHETSLVYQKQLINTQAPLFYALKEILIQVGHPEQLKKERQFKTEIQILQKLDHPGILKILDWSGKQHIKSSYPLKLYMLTEWGSGGNFLNLIDAINGKKIFQQKRTSILTHLSAQIIAVIQYLQNMGISHRDIKAQNFILDDKYQLKLIDFGLAEVYNNSKIDLESYKTDQFSNDEAKKQHGYIGSKHYISPQMIERRRRQSTPAQQYCKTDIWSAGILIYYMFTKSYPFEGNNTYFILQAIKKKQLDLSLIIDQKLRQLLEGMLQKRPEDRWQISRIKSSEFFQCIDWSSLYEKESPLATLQKKQGKESLFFRQEVIVKIENQSKLRIVELIRKKSSYNLKNKEVYFQTSIKLNQKGQLSMNQSSLSPKQNTKVQDALKIVQTKDQESKPKSKQQITQVDNNKIKNYLTIGRPNSNIMFKYMQLLEDTKIQILKRVCRIIWPTQRQGAKLHPSELQIHFKAEQQQQSFIDSFINISKL